MIRSFNVVVTLSVSGYGYSDVGEPLEETAHYIGFLEGTSGPEMESDNLFRDKRLDEMARNHGVSESLWWVCSQWQSPLVQADPSDMLGKFDVVAGVYTQITAPHRTFYAGPFGLALKPGYKRIDPGPGPFAEWQSVKSGWAEKAVAMEAAAIAKATARYNDARRSELTTLLGKAKNEAARNAILVDHLFPR